MRTSPGSSWRAVGGMSVGACGCGWGAVWRAVGGRLEGGWEPVGLALRPAAPGRYCFASDHAKAHDTAPPASPSEARASLGIERYSHTSPQGAAGVLVRGAHLVFEAVVVPLAQRRQLDPAAHVARDLRLAGGWEVVGRRLTGGWRVVGLGLSLRLVSALPQPTRAIPIRSLPRYAAPFSAQALPPRPTMARPSSCMW
jgi:hypothetical protein